MKKSISLFLTLVMVLALTTSALAAPVAQTTFTYISGFQVQNLSTSIATVTLTFYDNSTGLPLTPFNDTIAASGSKTYFPLPAVVPSPFTGSAVITSNQPVASIANILGTAPTFAAASYVAVDQSSTTVSIPLLMKANSGYTTWYSVQNIGATDTSVSVAYSDGTSAGPVILKTGAAHIFNQATETHNTAVFSATVTSTVNPVAVAVLEESSTIMFAYNGFRQGSLNPVIPLVNVNNSGYITGVQIQNTGATPTDVTVSYTPSSAGTACTETQTITGGASKTFTLGAFTNSIAGENCVNGEKFIGSAKVTGNTASLPLVAIVNQLKPGVNGEAYGAFDPAAGTATVVLPLIMDRNGGFFTAFSLMNAGTSDVTVSCTFTGTTYTVPSQTLQAGKSLVVSQNNAVAAGYVGSGTCTGSAGAKLVAIVNELSLDAGDRLLVYEGINR